MSVIIVTMGLLWMIGLGLGRICTGPRPQALHEGSSN